MAETGVLVFATRSPNSMKAFIEAASMGKLVSRGAICGVYSAPHTPLGKEKRAKAKQRNHHVIWRITQRCVCSGGIRGCLFGFGLLCGQLNEARGRIGAEGSN